MQSASGYWSNGSDHVDRLMKRQMFIRSWIRLVSQSASRHRTAVQRHPDAVAGAIGTLLEFVTQNNAAAEYGSAFQEYLQAATSPSSPIADELSACLRRWMGNRPNQALVETVLKVTGRQHGDLNRVAVVLEAAIECYDGTEAALAQLLPADVTNELIASCWRQEALLTWYCLLRMRALPGVDEAPYVLQQLLSDCTSLNLRYIGFHFISSAHFIMSVMRDA